MPFMDPNPGPGTAWMNPDGGPDPVAPPGNGTPYGVAASGFSLLAGLLKGMANVQAGNFNATVNRQNAVLADISAGDAIARGHLAAATALLKGSVMQGKQTTALVASGVQANAGSALDVLSGTALMSKLDADRIGNDAAREAWGYRTKATQFRQRATLDETQSENAAGASILGGIQGAATYGRQTMLNLS